MLERLRGKETRADDTTTPINRSAPGDKSQ